MKDWLAPLVETGAEAYYVGGCVRDWLMGRRLKDIDLVTSAHTWRVGQAIADRMRAHLFWLREEEGVARVLRPGRDGVQIDLSPLRLPIEADLRARDFTVNAMAVPLEAGLRAGAPILDPTGGQADLAARRLRLVGPETLASDPLRLMRAVRLSEQLRFTLDAESEARVGAEAASLARVSAERVRDELFQMLPAAWAPRALDRLRQYHLLPVLLPAAAGVSDATWKESLRRVRTLHRLMGARLLPLALRQRLRAPLTGDRPRGALLKWAAVLDATRGAQAEGPLPEARASAARLRLGAREGQLLATLLREEDRAEVLLRAGQTEGREMHRFARAAGGWALETLIFAATRHEWQRTGSGLAADWQRTFRLPPSAFRPLPSGAALLAVLEGAASEEAALAAPLLSGIEVMDLLNVPAGPTVGMWLDAVAAARAERIVTTPADARAWLLKEAEGPLPAERRAPDGCGSDRADAD
jgi:tRNA nucleotidyltransferase/poly(A) polymerase